MVIWFLVWVSQRLLASDTSYMNLMHVGIFAP